MQYTIEQATDFEPRELEALSMNDLHIDSESKARAMRVWHWLLGLTGGGDTDLASPSLSTFCPFPEFIGR